MYVRMVDVRRCHACPALGRTLNVTLTGGVTPKLLLTSSLQLPHLVNVELFAVVLESLRLVENLVGIYRFD